MQFPCRDANHEEGEPLNVGRKSRTIPPALRRARNARDRSCRFHHRQVHEGRVVVQTLDDGALRFVKPNGESFDSIAPHYTRPLDWHQLLEDHQEQGIPIDKNTATTLWRGETMDYGLAVAVLLQRSHRPRRVSAETLPATGN